jgi:hypothetical protein
LAPPDIVLSDGTAWTHVDVSSTVAAQTASNITTTAISGVTGSNVQDMLSSLNTIKANKAGDTFTGNIILDAASIVYDTGSFNTTVSAATASAARTITFPNQSGNVLVSGNTSIVDGDISASAGIAYSKLATLTSGNIIVGNASNTAASVAMSGDVTIGNTGVTAISSGVIVDADVSASAGIAFSKLASLTSGSILVGNSSNTATAVAMSGDITITNAGVTAIGSGVIVDGDISPTAEIAVSKLANGSARQLLQTDAAGTGVEWATNISIPGTLGVTGETTLKEIKETVYTAIGTIGSLSLDPANGTIQTTGLTGNVTFTEALQSGQSVLLSLGNGSSYTVTWPTVTWITANGNVAPTLTTYDMLAFFKIGSTLYAAYLGSYA